MLKIMHNKCLIHILGEEIELKILVSERNVGISRICDVKWYIVNNVFSWNKLTVFTVDSCAEEELWAERLHPTLC
jgi:hypothetical protein